MAGPFRRWRRRRLLARHTITDVRWRAILRRHPVLQTLAADQLDRLREYATVVAHEKAFEPAGGMEVDGTVRDTIAVLACLPVLNLGLDRLDSWRSTIVYPGEFFPEVEEMDAAGVIHTRREARTGEAWQRGPLVLAWEDVEASGALDGYNPVIHEIAHVLDGANGDTNGFPPLPRSMDPSAWTEAFETAYADLADWADEVGDEQIPIDPYALESPAEFFAVTSEYFFELPDVLADAYPEVYRQFQRFYGPIGRETARIRRLRPH